jgi:hypothetical protein
MAIADLLSVCDHRLPSAHAVGYELRASPSNNRKGAAFYSFRSIRATRAPTSSGFSSARDARNRRGSEVLT